MQIDLRTASYDEFLEFVFNRVPEDDPEEKWFWKTRPLVIVEPRTVVGHLTRMCSESAHLVPRFTMRQIAEGLDFVFGAGGRDWFREQLWNPAVPWVDRRRCILAIPELYAQLFETGDDCGIGFMLWDWIAYDYESGTRSPATDSEDARVQDAMFDALTRMLQSDNPDTQSAAIHGLGHLRHVNSTRAIGSFLSSQRELDASVRSYARDVLEDNFQ